MSFQLDEKMMAHNRAIITRNYKIEDLNINDPIKFKPGMMHYVLNERKMFISVEPYIDQETDKYSVYTEVVTKFRLNEILDQLMVGNADLNNYYTKIDTRRMIDEETAPIKQKLDEMESTSGYHTHSNMVALQQIDASKIVDWENKKHSHANTTALNTITIDKINEWNEKSNFNGSYLDLTDKPTSMLANGGNADTLEGKNSKYFATKTELDDLKAIVERELARR